MWVDIITCICIILKIVFTYGLSNVFIYLFFYFRIFKNLLVIIADNSIQHWFAIICNNTPILCRKFFKFPFLILAFNWIFSNLKLLEGREK